MCRTTNRYPLAMTCHCNLKETIVGFLQNQQRSRMLLFLPPHLFTPVRSVVVDGMQYQRPMHRILLYLQRQQDGYPIPKFGEQASHLCMDAINTDGRGEKHCVRPEHMVVEDDQTNKLRRNCAGWIWIWPTEGNPGNFWYPTCTHDPPCLRYTDRSNIPTELQHVE